MSLAFSSMILSCKVEKDYGSSLYKVVIYTLENKIVILSFLRSMRCGLQFREKCGLHRDLVYYVLTDFCLG